MMKKLLLLTVYAFALQIVHTQIIEISPEKESLIQRYLSVR